MMDEAVKQALKALEDAEFDLNFAREHFPSLALSFFEKVESLRTVYLEMVKERRASSVRHEVTLPAANRASSRPVKIPAALPLPTIPRSYREVVRQVIKERQERHTMPATPAARSHFAAAGRSR